MLRREFEAWLKAHPKRYSYSVVTGYPTECAWVEKHCQVDLDEEYRKDQMQSLISRLRLVDGRSALGSLIEGDVNSNLATYRRAVKSYMKFVDAGSAPSPEDTASAPSPPDRASDEDKPLGGYFGAFVERMVDSGRYGSSIEVLRDGLRLLEERENLRELTMAELRRLVEEGRLSGPSDVDGPAFLNRLEAKYQAMADAQARRR